MTLILHEIKRNRLALIIWCYALAVMLGVCVLIYPEMASQMEEMSNVFANMGAFSEAFGMDQLKVGEFMDFFAMECGETLGLGGAIFAAILGGSILAKEEKEHTAELLLTHPISRARIVTYKLIAMLMQIVILNLAAIAVTSVAVLAIGEKVNVGKMALLFLSCLMVQIEIAVLSFCASTFFHRGGLGVGLGIALLFYFANVVANIAEAAEILKYITPFAYADGAYIIANASLEIKYVIIGTVLTAVGVCVSYWRYTTKDIA